MSSAVTRASYQDSNPLAYQRSTNKAVQKLQPSADKALATRDTNTFKSDVFYKPQQGAAGLCKTRQQNTFDSTVFGCAQSNRLNRKKLGGESKGTETLFGRDNIKYVPSSTNEQIERPTSSRLEPEAHISTKVQVHKEFYGPSAETFGTNEHTKHDGALMA